MYTRNVREKSSYFADSIFFITTHPHIRFRIIILKFICFTFWREVHRVVNFTQVSNMFYSQKDMPIQFIFNMQCGVYRLVLLRQKGTQNTENPPVKRVALQPIRRDMKPTSQSTNQENPCEERLSVSLSSGWREMVIFSVISIIPAPNRGGSNQAYTVWGDLVLWRGCAQRDKGVHSRPSSCCTVN